LSERQKNNLKITITLFLLILSGNLYLSRTLADIIYFKDGMKTVCEVKAWEVDGEIFCEYDGGLISYSKDDVLRIDKTVFEEEEPQPGKSEKTQTSENISPSSLKSIKSDEKGSGILFYDPRRQKKYWSSETARHSSYKAAIQDLAHEFDHSPEWIEAHIGDSNDLLEIRKNLTNAESTNDSQDAIKTVDNPVSETILFYDPRRAAKYWISSTDKLNTFREAIEALALEFNQSGLWVEENMGETNDLAEIRRNLSSKKAEASAENE